MLDVEFLRLGVSPSKPILYQYQSRGILKQRIINFLTRKAHLRDHIVQKPMIENIQGLINRGGLYPLYFYCDVTEENGLKYWRKNAEATLRLIADVEFNDVCLLVPERRPLAEIPGWEQVRDKFCVIVEPEISSSSLMPILRYLESEQGLSGSVSLCDRPDFVGLFERLVDQGQLDELSELMQAFDTVVLGCWDPDSDTFAPEYYATESQARRSTRLYWSLRSFVRSFDGGDVAAFVVNASQRLRELQDGEQLMREIERATRRNLRDAVTEAERLSAVLWASVLLAWRTGEADEARRLSLMRSGTDMTLVRIERAARDYLSRASATDALKGLWPLLRRHGDRVAAATKEELGGVAFSLLLELAQHLAARGASEGSHWSARLHEWALEIDVAATRVDENPGVSS